MGNLKLNKKGFTLIELLAVIVVLGIILVIAIPSVLSIQTTAKKGAFEDQALLFIKTIETCVAQNAGDTTKCDSVSEIQTFDSAAVKTGTSATITITNNVVTLTDFTYTSAGFKVSGTRDTIKDAATQVTGS